MPVMQTNNSKTKILDDQFHEFFHMPVYYLSEGFKCMLGVFVELLVAEANI